MKKSKLSITLVTGFIAAMALSACGNVTSDKTAIATFTPYGSKEKIALLTDDVYNAYTNLNKKALKAKRITTKLKNGLQTKSKNKKHKLIRTPRTMVPVTTLSGKQSSKVKMSKMKKA